jgi:hypothetical protein
MDIGSIGATGDTVDPGDTVDQSGDQVALAVTWHFV